MTISSGARRLAVAASLAAITAAAAHSQTPPSTADPGLIRLDVYPTASGSPVQDLTASDFEIIEDDIPQKIEAFTHVTAGSGAPASQPKIFVVFLDTYFTDVKSSRDVRTPLAMLLDRLVGPDDLIGIMTPDMAAADLTLAHRSGSSEDMLSKYWFWGRDLEAIDPVEEQYLECYPKGETDADPERQRMAGMGDEMVQRRREKRVIDALADLAQHLRGVGDGRKAVIAVTDGWVLFPPNLSMTERTGIRQPRFGTRRGGRPDATTSAPPADTESSSQRCDQDRVSLSLVDDRAKFDSLVDAANRGNISFYPLTAGGLRGMDPNAAPAAQSGARAADDPGAAKRKESVQSLAANTDGLALAQPADIDPALHRIVADLSSYYLLTYQSTNPTPDGKFRKVEVRTTRAGVEVRSRRGYRIPRAQDLEPSPTAASTARRAPRTPVEAALAAVKADKPNLPLRIGAAYAPLGLPDSNSTRFHMWAMAEIDPDVARHGEWMGGGTIALSVTAKDGQTLVQQSVTLIGGQHSVSIDLGEVATADGEAVFHASARPAGGGHQNYTEALALDSLAWPGRPLVFRRSPETALRYVPTASLEFERTERIRVELPLASAPAAAAAELLDRSGKPMAIPATVATRTDGKLTWLTAEVVLAPLAEGTYLVRLEPDRAHPDAGVVSGFRVVP